jgi:hypothetical protein
MVFAAYHAFIWRIKFEGMPRQVRVLLVRGDEEKCRILARDDTVHASAGLPSTDGEK